MKLDIGGNRTVPATPQAVEEALPGLGDDHDFILCTADDGRFMQIGADGTSLEVRDTPGSEEHRQLRANPEDVKARGALPAFASFIAGNDEWRTQYRWTDITAELSKRSGCLGSVAAVAAIAVWLLSA